MFTPVRRQKLAEQVADSMRDAIVAGRFAVGDPLPSERELAESFGVNRSSVREAIVRLEAQGLVEIRQGGATRVRDFLEHAGLQLLPYLLAPGGSIDIGLLRDVLELRVFLLQFTGGTAAMRATPELIEHLEQVLAQLDEAVGVDAEEVQLLDYDFFDALVLATGNRALMLVNNAVRNVYMSNAQHFLALYSSRFHTDHLHAVIAAIRAGDADAAASAMVAHAGLAQT